MKKILALMLVLTFVLSMSAMSVSAVDTDSDATLELKAGALEIVDPPAPDPELPNIEAGGRGMYFGTRTVSVSDETYLANKVGTPEASQDLPASLKQVGLVVSDARGDAAAKWYVKVKISKFAGTAPVAADTLKGFELTLKHDTVVGVVGTGAAANKPAATTPIMLAADAASKDIFTANATNGSAGKWGANWQPELLVKAGTATKNSHKAVVTWSLTETP